MTDKKHTPEPWGVRTFPIIENLAQNDWHEEKLKKYSTSHCLDKESYYHAIDCVNALAGIDNPAEWVAKMKELEGKPSEWFSEIAIGISSIMEEKGKLQAEKKEILEALEQMLSRFNEAQCRDTWDKKAVWVAKSAVAKVKGE